MIGHDVAAALPELRAQAESLMDTTCTIERLTTTWDEALQKSVTTWAPVHADVPCAVDIPPVTASSLLTAEASTAETPRVKIPVTFDGIEPDDRVTVVGYGVMWVTHVPIRSHQVQRRLQCRWTR